MAKEETITGLIERFGDLPDPRVEGRTDHDLLDIIVLALFSRPCKIHLTPLPLVVSESVGDCRN